MLIKSITLKNFRQYIDTTIEFATDVEKNITVVMGDNGTGKTTFAQAFLWVLYGKTEFQVQEIINRITRERMTMGQSKTVSVALQIAYNEKEYTIKRSVVYKKNAQLKLEETDHKFTISTIDENGELYYFPDGRRNYMIKQFLPEDLSRFFFFDGERIEEMSKEIASGKSDDFKEAVYSLVGLRATQNAMWHLKGQGGRNTVIRYYKNEIEKNNKSAQAMEESNRKVQQLQEEIEKKILLFEEKRKTYNKCNEELKECQRIIFSETPKMELKKEYEVLQEKIKSLKKKRENTIGKEFLKEFSGGFYNFCARPLVEQVAPRIRESGEDENTIPDLSKRMILHLVEKRKRCLCGADITAGSPEYETLISLIESAQSKTLSMSIHDYHNCEYNMKKHTNTYMEEMKRKLQELSELEARITGYEQEANEKMEMLGNTTKGEAAKQKKKVLEGELEKLHSALVDIEAALKNKEKEREHEEKVKGSLVIVNENSLKNARFLAYAERLYDTFKKGYTESENKYRVKLEHRMNEIFKIIYDGNIRISIDPKYRINVQVQEEFAAEDEVERNTAQGYALIFAFISAIIDLAKEKVNKGAFDEKDMIDMTKEGYPLVMDAPLSAFDKTRIKSICTEIPKIADQVIMFIKDTDGDIAEKHMSSKIGKRYLVQKVDGSNLHSEVIGR